MSPWQKCSINWILPVLQKKKTDDSVNHTKTPVIAQKEPKTIARLQAKRNPRTRIPDSEICPENIIIGSSIYIPYKKIPKNQKGQGKFGKKLKFPISSSSAMPKHKHTATQKELVKPARARKLAGMNTGAKPQKTMEFTKSKHVPQAAYAPHKGGGGTPPTGGIKKPKKHKPGVIALREICRFQKSVDLLIPLLSFDHVIHEVAQDFKVMSGSRVVHLWQFQRLLKLILLIYLKQPTFVPYIENIKP